MSLKMNKNKTTVGPPFPSAILRVLLLIIALLLFYYSFFSFPFLFVAFFCVLLINRGEKLNEEPAGSSQARRKGEEGGQGRVKGEFVRRRGEVQPH